MPGLALWSQEIRLAGQSRRLGEWGWAGRWGRVGMGPCSRPLPLGDPSAGAGGPPSPILPALRDRGGPCSKGQERRGSLGLPPALQGARRSASWPGSAPAGDGRDRGVGFSAHFLPPHLSHPPLLLLWRYLFITSSKQPSFYPLRGSKAHSLFETAGVGAPQAGARRWPLPASTTSGRAA